MSRNGKVIVAMSGGVDSSVAACLLQEQGYECVGVFMRVGAHAAEAENACVLEEGTPGTETGRHDCATLGRKRGGDHATPRRFKHGCCSAADALDARAIAGRLGIPFYALNFEQDFDRIIEYFVDEYARARTPNPCVMCNIQLKFGRLLRYADMMDAEFIATGHYARVLKTGTGSAPENPRLAEEPLPRGACPRFRLARSRNAAKDQSYVLFGIDRGDLPRCLFPLGEIADKSEVRRTAAELGLRVHDKPDSQEICFVPDNDYKQVVRERRPETVRSGEVVDAMGNVLGRHEGVASYTIGQRRGLGIAAGVPIYVTKLDVLSNTVTVGSREDLLSGGLIAERVNWLVDPPARDEPRPAEIKIRYMHTPAPGSIRVRGQEVADRGDQRSALPSVIEATFDEPQSAVTPGQAAVFYGADGIVLGGGWIRGRIPEGASAPDAG